MASSPSTSTAAKANITLGGAGAHGYRLAPLADVAAFIPASRHLPRIASEEEMRGNGVGVTEIAMQLLEKVEELTLHAIEQGKRNAELYRKLKQ